MASILKHLRSSTADKRPTASGLADGQIALNTASGTPAMFFKDSAGNIVKVGPAHIGTTAPNVSPAGSAGNSDGELWIDESLTTRGLKYYDGTAFINLTPSGTTSTVGLVELATDAETQAGTDNARVVTPSGLQSKISDSTSTTSSTTIASSTAVKSAFDLANAALPKTGGTLTGELLISPSGSLVFEGSSDDSFETTIAVTNPTADRTITFPNVTGNVVTTGDSGTVTSTMILDDTIVNADINSAAAIAHSKLANITAGSVLLGNASNVPTATALSGDVTINSSGVTAISAGVIVNADINASAAIVDTKLDTIATADKVSLSALNIDGATDIGGALENGDLFIVDDGAGGTNRKAQAFRMAQLTYSGVTGDITVASGGTAAISAGVIVNADVNASAAIAGTKVSPDFGSQTITTTGVVSAALGAAATPSLTFTGDLNTGIYSPGADQVAISTGGSGRLFVSSTGLVSLGQATSPNGLSLAVNGSDTQSAIGYYKNGTLYGIFGSESAYNGSGTSNNFVLAGFGAGNNLRVLAPNDYICSAGGSERLRITSGGLVGVGTSSPGAVLDVAPDANRNLQVQGKSGTTYGLEIKNGTANSGGEFHVTAASSGAVVVNRGTTEIARFNSTGLGIGTSTVVGRLQVGTTSTTDNNALVFNRGIKPSISATQTAILCESSGINSAECLTFMSDQGYKFLDDTGATEWMRLTSTGLGIGTTDMYGTLNVQRNTAAQYSTISLGDFVTASNSVGIYGRVSSAGIFGISSAGAPIVFYNAGSGTGEIGRWDTSGRFLVGTSTTNGGSDAFIQVRGNSSGSNFEGKINLSTGTATNSIVNDTTLGSIQFGNNSTIASAALIECKGDAQWGTNDYPTKLVFSVTQDGSSSPTERVRLDNVGNFFVYSSGNDTVVAGNAAGSGTAQSLFTGVHTRTSTTGGGTVAYRIYNNGTTFSVSDARQKKNVETARDGYLEDLQQLRVVKYNWIDQADTESKELGLIAQEVAEVFPGLVQSADPSDPESTLGIKSSVFSFMLIKALQEAGEKIEALEARLSALESA